ARRGDRALDDAGGARRSQRVERQSQAADRKRGRTARAGSESAAGTVPAASQDGQVLEKDVGNAMATRIRLRRVGRKGQAYFRIVVADSKSPRDGRFVALIGNYNPRANPAVIEVNAEQARAWLEKGALPTDTVRSLLKKAGVLGKSAPPAKPTA